MTTAELKRRLAMREALRALDRAHRAADVVQSTPRNHSVEIEVSFALDDWEPGQFVDMPPITAFVTVDGHTASAEPFRLNVFHSTATMKARLEREVSSLVEVAVRQESEALGARF
jgi:hypothetical protein